MYEIIGKYFRTDLFLAECNRIKPRLITDDLSQVVLSKVYFSFSVFDGVTWLSLTTRYRS